jgi:hypothetical protein
MESDEDRFWEAAAHLLARDGVTRSTMMGLPSLRVRGKFFAAFDRSSGDLLIRVPAARVDQLIASGVGGAVAPGRPPLSRVGGDPSGSGRGLACLSRRGLHVRRRKRLS